MVRKRHVEHARSVQVDERRDIRAFLHPEAPHRVQSDETAPKQPSPHANPRLPDIWVVLMVHMTLKTAQATATVMKRRGPTDCSSSLPAVHGNAIDETPPQRPVCDIGET